MTSETNSSADLDRSYAIRLLCHHLEWLEHLAVRMCERAEAVPGQLEDELRHRQLFHDQVGEDGIDPIEPIRALIDWTESLEGEAAIVVLNIVAEHWLETILRCLLWWKVLPSLMRSVLADEERHVALAPKPEPGLDVAPYVRELERHLHAIASDPRFMWPLMYLGTVQGVAEMAQAVHGGHQAACDRLGIDTGPFFHEMHACRAEAQDHDLEPAPVPLDPWRRSALNLDLQPMIGWAEVNWHWSQEPADVEARVVRAVQRTLAADDSLRRTINPTRRELYQPQRADVALRRQGHPGVVNVYVRPEERLDVLSRLIRANHRRAIAAAVELPEILPEVHRLMPAPRAAAVVTSLMGAGGISYGLAPLSEIEGAVWSVGVPGEFLRPPHWTMPHILKIGVYADHRAVDGQELCRFLEGLRHHLKGD